MDIHCSKISSKLWTTLYQFQILLTVPNSLIIDVFEDKHSQDYLNTWMQQIATHSYKQFQVYRFKHHGYIFNFGSKTAFVSYPRNISHPSNRKTTSLKARKFQESAKNFTNTVIPKNSQFFFAFTSFKILKSPKK